MQIDFQLQTYLYYEDFVAFLLERPSLQALSAFRLSEASENRLNELLEASKNNRLSAEERLELEAYVQFEHFLRVLKYRALQAQQQT
jgi:hypothetical protein